MKYIRTKYAILEDKMFDSPLCAFSRKEIAPLIIKQADTIEELCDNFLVEYTNGEHMMFHDFYHLKRHHDFYGQDYHHVAGRYGCIWVVGKGLIYVAKMNKEGDLELL